MRQWLVVLGWCMLSSAAAQTGTGAAVASMVLTEGDQPQGYVARIEAHTRTEIETLMDRAEAVVEKVLDGEKVEPIQFVLHGEEVRLFFRKNYKENKALVDRAARLDAFDVIDIKVCETWMRFNDEEKAQLYPFIETVPYGPAEEKRLLSEGYLYF